MRPVVLEPNRPRAFYRDSGALSRFRGTTESDSNDRHPEDWIASSTAQFGNGSSGLTTLPDGQLLSEAIRQDPTAWLGQAHMDRFGPDSRLLVKLLDAGERLPVHVHPDGAFAADHLHSPHGKTEAWLIVDAPDDAVVHLGFNRDVGAEELAVWRAGQDTESLLAATNRIPVSAGDSVFVPAGMPHSIGEGIFLVELQEPSDLSIFLESRGFDIGGPGAGSLGLPWDIALGCVQRQGTSSDRIAVLTSQRGSRAFPAEADVFFRADTIVPDPVAVLDVGYGVLVVIAGSGEIATENGAETTPLLPGSTILVPFAAGPTTIRGEGLVIIRARPPE